MVNVTSGFYKFAAVALLLLTTSCWSDDNNSSANKNEPPTPGKEVTAFTQNQLLGRGVNILGYDPIWKSREEGRFKEKYFRVLKEGGFQSVRINLYPFRHMGAAPDYALSDPWLQTLDWAVDNSLAQNLAVILDLHEFTSMAKDPSGLKDRMMAFWRQISNRYADKPSTVFFEILNEPNQELTDEMWNGYLVDALDLIRKTNPDRTVVIGPGHWNSIGGLETLQIPEEDRNIIVTVHYYSPMKFTHQGAPWVEQFKDTSGVEWTGTDEEKNAVRTDFQKAQDWAQAHDRPLFLGEFGAYDKAPMDSRVRYTDFVARTAESLGWSWAYWQFDSDFILYDVTKDKWIDPIHKALIPE
jgi:endoglucanase